MKLKDTDPACAVFIFIALPLSAVAMVALVAAVVRWLA